MHLFDSSAWIAIFKKNDPHHSAARQAFEEARGTIYIPYIVIAETATHLVYKHSREQAERFVRFISSHPRIVPVDASAAQDMDAFLNSNKEMSFADFAIIAYAIRMQLTLITFDKEVEREFKKATRTL